MIENEIGRIIISELKADHSAFILELVNSSGWKEFIGERNVHSIEDSKIYIINILANDNIKYHVVSIKSENIPIGIVTFIKRDYLGHGYAFEASKHLLDIYKLTHPIILATTKTSNKKSIKLLEKLGFLYSHDINQSTEDDPLIVYQV